MVSSSNQRENRIAHDVSSEAAVALGRDVSEPGVNRLAAAITSSERGPLERMSDLTDEDKETIRDAYDREHRVGRDEPRYLNAVIETILARKVCECVVFLESLHRAAMDRIKPTNHTDDGSPSMLPDPFDGVSPADGGGGQ